jgi:hypothetical protein
LLPESCQRVPRLSKTPWNSLFFGDGVIKMVWYYHWQQNKNRVTDRVTKRRYRGCYPMPLTDNAIKALKPKEKRYKVFDGQGLHLEVQTSGTKVWRITYYFDTIKF